jgi:hypothetical protein
MNSNKIDKLNKFSAFKNINFKHSNYGIIKEGVYKGLEIEIRDYIPQKLEVKMDNRLVLSTRDALRGKKYDIINIVPARVNGILNDFRNVTLNAENIFYRDVLLKRKDSSVSNHYASVKKITQKGLNNDYYIRGEIFDNKRYVDIEFRSSDILEMMNNFKINEKEIDKMEVDEIEYVYEKEPSSDIDSDSDSDSDSMSVSDSMSDGMSVSDSMSYDESVDGLDNDDIMTSYKERAFSESLQSSSVGKSDHAILKYIEHILLSIRYKGIIKSTLFSKKENRLEEITNMRMTGNVMFIMDKIKKVTDNINNILKTVKKSITINSIDHMFIISGVVFMNLLKEERNKTNYTSYIEYLIKSSYFKNINANIKTSILLKHSDLFGCEIMKKKLDINKIVINLQSCIIKIIETISDSAPLSIKLASPTSQQIPQDNIEFIKLKTSERVQVPIPDTVRQGLSIKDQLIYKRASVEDNSKLKLYDYLIENIDNVDDEITRLRPKVLSILRSISNDFVKEYELCNDNICNENIISKNINMTFDKIRKGEMVNIDNEENMILQQYTELHKIRILKNRERAEILKDAPDYKKGELDVANIGKIKKFKSKIKSMVGKKSKRDKSVSKSSKSSKSSNDIIKKLENIKIDDTDMVRYLLNDVDINKIE